MIRRSARLQESGGRRREPARRFQSRRDSGPSSGRLRFRADHRHDAAFSHGQTWLPSRSMCFATILSEMRTSMALAGKFRWSTKLPRLVTSGSQSSSSSHTWSGRALARAPWVTFPAPPLKFRTSGFPGSGLKHQAPQRRSVRRLPRHAPRLRLTQPCPWHYPEFAPPFGSTAPSFNPDGILGRCRALRPGVTCHLRHLGPEALAPDGLCCPVHHRLIGLIRQSGGLRAISRTAVIGAVLDIQGSQHPVCPPHLPVFHC